MKQLIQLGLYYNRPADELVFLTTKEHAAVHRKFGGKISEKGKRELARKATERKNMRILEFLEEYDPSKPLDENIEEIRERGFSGIDGLASKTYIGYIRDAKANGDLVARYPWLSDIDVKPKPKGYNHKKSIAIRNRMDGAIERFGSVNECARFLGISITNFYGKFLKGKGLTVKKWEVFDYRCGKPNRPAKEIPPLF